MGISAKGLSRERSLPPSLLDLSRVRTKLTLSSSQYKYLEGTVLSEYVKIP